jgi:hypothetical protein
LDVGHVDELIIGDGLKNRKHRRGRAASRALALNRAFVRIAVCPYR